MYYRVTDIAKYKHEATVISENVKAHPDSIFFPTAKEGCKKLSALFKQLSIAKDEPLIRIESAGHYRLSAHTFLPEPGHEVKVINPTQYRTFRKMCIHQTKNDSNTISTIRKEYSPWQPIPPKDRL